MGNEYEPLANKWLEWLNKHLFDHGYAALGTVRVRESLAEVLQFLAGGEAAEGHARGIAEGRVLQLDDIAKWHDSEVDRQYTKIASLMLVGSERRDYEVIAATHRISADALRKMAAQKGGE